MWLAPNCSDSGIDVISKVGSRYDLSSASTVSVPITVDREALLELLASCDTFRAILSVAGLAYKTVLITNRQGHAQQKCLQSGETSM